VTTGAREGGPRRRRPAGRRPRLDPAVARAQLLAAGLDLAREQSLGATFGHLRINDLARSAGLTSGAFYHYWDGQDAYRADVLDAVLAGPRADAAPVAPPTGLTLGRAVDAVARQAFAARREGRDHPLELALWAHDDPRARTRLLDRARQVDRVVALPVAQVLARAGRAPADGWTLDGLAETVVTLGDGLTSLALIDPHAVADRGPWSTPGLLSLLLLAGASEPGPPVDVPAAVDPSRDPGEGDEPRQARLLALGVEAARHRPAGNAFDHIRAEDVVARLDLTIGAFYHYWDSQDDYRDDLVDALFAAERYLDPAGLEAESRRITEAGDLDAAIREATSWYWSIASEHPDRRIQFAFQTLDDPYLTPRLAAWNAELRQAWHAVLDALLDRTGRHWRSPVTTELVVVGLSASLDGLIVRHDLDPTGLGPDEDGWTRWGRVGRALILAGSVEGDETDPVEATALLDG
jgi:AcrR family transcriptional regulator